MDTPIADPQLAAAVAQRAASDPAVSAFVAASAGSGKTKLLTDRLLRLLLAGNVPERIQCLTYTTAAAAEMANRLRDRLGRWVKLDEHALAADLAALGAPTNKETRDLARRLFVRVLDQPGGMRIGTFHAFCQSVLRRFPLEAGVSPHFDLIEDRDVAEHLREAREVALAGEADAALIAAVAHECTLEQFTGHLGKLRANIEDFADALTLPAADLAEAQRRVLGVTHQDEAALLAGAVIVPNEVDLRDAARIVADLPKLKEAPARARAILAWLEKNTEHRRLAWTNWPDCFLTDAGKPYDKKYFAPAAVDHLAAPFLAEADRILAVEDCRRALTCAALSAAFIALARPMLAGVAARKSRSGQVEYADLIAGAAGLMRDPGAAWVLYKLDGGLDHLLLDEAQDTSPAQWQIAHALTAEFFAGEGARATHRTIFAVGDRKQSIYSFQGADAAGFDRHRAALGRAVVEAGQEWRGETELTVSFRSTEAVLALVDAVFADPEAARGVADHPLRHRAVRAAAGTVELWPLAPRPPAERPDPWTIAAENITRSSAEQVLAEAIAARIAREIADRVPVAARGGAPLAHGDILILIQKRTGGFGRALVRALKQRDIPTTGLDRATLATQPAVADLLALADVLLLPDDDLSLAVVLRSPFGGVGEDSLRDLAIGRPGSLWSALRDRHAERRDWDAAHGRIARLLAQADFVPPHTLFVRALGEEGGRAAILRRFGEEAAEPLDELLAATLAHARAHPASLQGFVHWLRRSAIESKHEAEATDAGLVRIMTAHRAKGLEAPLVILPDTTRREPRDDCLTGHVDPVTGKLIPVFAPRVPLRCGNIARVLSERAKADAEEANRLLYVALTRAKDRLIVCGWQTGQNTVETCWHKLIERGFGRLATRSEAFEGWGDRLIYETGQTGAAPSRPAAPPGPAALPAWTGRRPDWRPLPPPPETGLARLAPSRPENMALGPVPASASPLAGRREDRFRRGQVVHALLQHLPDLPQAMRPEAARAYLANAGIADPDTTLAETLAILDDPVLAPLFGPGSRAEAPIAGVVAGQVVGGLIDRLAILPDRVLIADYKTNREPPPENAPPVLYLRQLAAYRAVLRAIHPDRPVTCALVWTRAARIDVLPDARLDPFDPAAQVSAPSTGEPP